ncbi:MAG TPA: hypothetical protein VGD81_05360 [Opitutaceae bacterium]
MPSSPSRWNEALSTCLAELEREQVGSACPVVDHEFSGGSGGSGGSAEYLVVWFICRTRGEKNLFTDTELARKTSMLRRKMLDRGLPEAAVDSLTIKVTSREEIEAAGGRLRFFP